MNIVRTGKAFAILGAYLGLACGVLYSVGGFFYDLFNGGLNAGTWMAFGALVGMPAIGATGGYIIGVLFALLVRAFVSIRDRVRG